jgi:hypothetical protein
LVYVGPNAEAVASCHSATLEVISGPVTAQFESVLAEIPAGAEVTVSINETGLLDATNAASSTTAAVVGGVTIAPGASVTDIADTDEDGLADSVETDTGTYVSPGDTGTDPAIADHDGDGVADGHEVFLNDTIPTDTDSDDDGFGDKPATSHASVNGNAAEDNCPAIANAGQQNSEGRIDNGPGVVPVDQTVPRSDALGDPCDPDLDNDGLPNNEDVNPILASGICAAFSGSSDGHPSPHGGDLTNDDDADANPAVPMGTDASDNGPSWDTDADGVLDGYECANGANPRDRLSKPPALPGDGDDDDGDGLLNGWERRGWGTGADTVDSDGDGKSDCREAADVDGNSVVNSTGDFVGYANAMFKNTGKTIDFDLDKNGLANSTGDFVAMAHRVFGIKPCL